MFAKLLTISVILALGLSVVAHASRGGGHRQVYVVRPYDTLWSIATRHYAGDVREGVWKIEHENRLADATVVPGQRLLLP
jgi:LysM domain-containing protein